MADGELKGRVAVVTGGNGGIGLGMARGLAAAGAAVVVSGRNAEKSRARGRRARRSSGRPRSRSRPTWPTRRRWTRWCARTVERFGRLDILVNNAGMNIRKPVHELTLAEWRQVLDTNLTSAFLTSRAAYPIMKKNGGGKIINIGSMMSIFGASLRARLRRLQGRHRPAHEGDRVRVGRRQHPGQRGAAGLDRHRTDDQGAPGGRGPARSRARRARPPRAGACPTISPAWRCFSAGPPPTS